MQMLANDEKNEFPLCLLTKKRQIIRSYFTCQPVAKAQGRNFPLTEMAADLSIKTPLERMCQN